MLMKYGILMEFSGIQRWMFCNVTFADGLMGDWVV